MQFTKELADELTSIAEGFELVGENLFTFGQDAPEMFVSPETRFPYEPGRDERVDSLTSYLYEQAYCRPFDVNGYSGEPDLLDELSDANASRSRWDGPWFMVAGDESGSALLGQGVRRRLFSAGDYRLIGKAEENEAARYEVRLERGSASLQERFYYAYGECVADQLDATIQSRFYLALQPEFAPRWMAVLTAMLNRFSVPFRLKMLRYVKDYGRADAGVIYLPRRFAGFVASMLISATKETGGLNSRTPMFTRPLAGGLAYADSPPGGESFGFSRMRLVATALLDSKTIHSNAAQRLDAITDQFRAAGLDSRKPHLNPGNSDIRAPRRSSGSSQAAGVTESPLLDAAHACGRRLVRDAMFYKDECCWPGWDMNETSRGVRAGMCSSEGSLYDGSAGIALFLARLGALLEDDSLISNAIAGIRHAGRQAQEFPHLVGAYTGSAGVYYCASHIARLLNSDEIDALADTLLSQLGESAHPHGGELDISGGTAGVIRALILAPDSSRNDVRAPLVESLARKLADSAEACDQGVYWPNPFAIGGKALSGYSHGTSGIAAALMLAWQQTGDESLRNTALAAMDYEMSLFDAAHKNWPETRQNTDRSQHAEGPTDQLMTAWCFGAPGIVLAIARMQSDRYAVALNAAIETTRRWIESNQDREMADHSLCHGICGCMQILAEVGRCNDQPQLQTFAQAVAEQVWQKRRHGYWPSGADPKRESPGLMTGIAGVGHFYLFLANENMPSPLEI